jgi:hypothetical protein
LMSPISASVLIFMLFKSARAREHSSVKSVCAIQHHAALMHASCIIPHAASLVRTSEIALGVHDGLARDAIRHAVQLKRQHRASPFTHSGQVVHGSVSCAPPTPCFAPMSDKVANRLLGFGTGDRPERWTNPKLSWRACGLRYGLQWRNGRVSSSRSPLPVRFATFPPCTSRRTADTHSTSTPSCMPT